MPNYVSHGAKLKCQHGSVEGTLTVISRDRTFIGPQPQATALDFASGTNIPSFGKCKLQKCGCFPVITSRWLGGKDDYLIGNTPVLTKDCILYCQKGGTIRIVDPGQKTHVDRATPSKQQQVKKRQQQRKEESYEIEVTKIDANTNGVLSPDTQAELSWIIQNLIRIKPGETVVRKVPIKVDLPLDFNKLTVGTMDVKYTKKDLEDALDLWTKLLKNPVYRGVEYFMSGRIKVVKGALKVVGGISTAQTGIKFIAASDGPWAVATFSLGGYMFLDGVNSAVEGGHMFYNGVFSPDSSELNALRDWVYCRCLGKKLGETWYNWVSLSVGIISVVKGGIEVKEAQRLRHIKKIPNIRKAIKMGIKLEVVVIQEGGRLCISILEKTTKTKTPMVMERYLIEHEKLAKDLFFIKLDFDGAVDSGTSLMKK